VDAIISNKIFLALIAAMGYALATVAMKVSSVTLSLPIVLGLVLVLAAAVVAEITLLRQMHLGLAYIAIIATETLIVLGFAIFIGEGLSLKQLFGGAFVFLGIAMVSL
jgi:drug/metabolite transporter (DMT)-like permease